MFVVFLGRKEEGGLQWRENKRGVGLCGYDNAAEIAKLALQQGFLGLWEMLSCRIHEFSGLL